MAYGQNVPSCDPLSAQNMLNFGLRCSSSTKGTKIMVAILYIDNK